MASLTHVCMWSGTGWKRITADEAAALHPGGTVSAYSGLFMCELCGQYVLLTDGSYQVRHFRHSSSEKSKNCPERTFGAGYAPVCIPGEHELPIRICGVTPTSFRFEVGLVRVPKELIGKNLRLEIRPNGTNEESFVYLKERLNPEGVTYLSIGDKPFEKYALIIHGGNDKLRTFWPSEIQGINPSGTMFEQSTGKKLPYDADVEIGKEYLLLKCGNPYYGRTLTGISIRNVSAKRVKWTTWSLYSVSASIFNETAARFFLEYHCRLTGHPVSIQPVWPLYIEGSYIIKYDSKRVNLLVKGDATSVNPFPTAPVHQISKLDEHSALYEVQCNNRQQLISVGRTKALQYTYLWQEPLDNEAPVPEIVVTDITGDVVNSGELNAIPKNGTLRFCSQYDGEALIYKGNQLYDKQPLSANIATELTGIGWSTHIKLSVGLDCLWEAVFQKAHPQKSLLDDAELLKYVMSGAGALIPVPHALRNISLELSRYPKLCSWIKQSIKDNAIHEQSYRRLQEIYRNHGANKNIGG